MNDLGPAGGMIADIVNSCGKSMSVIRHFRGNDSQGRVLIIIIRQ